MVTTLVSYFITASLRLDDNRVVKLVSLDTIIVYSYYNEYRLGDVYIHLYNITTRLYVITATHIQRVCKYGMSYPR